ncbi:cytochrome c oxidase assembly protein subunit 15 [Mumia flava]|uniref:Cytochrome c oxidase assembly protein subunit 15 n=1 Tax=Mumia flava TaxID=1348852 RepID=A0A2M9B6L7_9ACTN|nr:COX15/CtaA family protein [Mumia flava]PJJ53601.1 cytochrome c oxidase assembly protein subunit 15 [Mumia flava]
MIGPFRDPTTRFVRVWAWTSLVANIGIIVTGGAVRLTGSGLGCPTWPKCTTESFVPHGELGWHGAIEFGNRLLTWVLVVVAIATWVAVKQWRPRRTRAFRLATIIAFGIPAQAVVGGITVLTDLNSWAVGIHLAISGVLVSLASALIRETYHPADAVPAPLAPAAVGLAWLTYAAMWVTVMIGTVVTGAGPHAGDPDTARNGLDPVAITQAHADAVFLTIGLSVGLLLLYRAIGAGPTAVTAATALVAVELAQGLIGFVQYATDLPEILVGMHLLGAGVLIATTTWATLAAHPRTIPAPASPGSAGGSAPAPVADA